MLKHEADEVILMERYTYRTATTLQLKPNGSYFLKLEFVDMTDQQREELQYIGKAGEIVSIRSKVIPEEAGVNRIVVAARLKGTDGAVIWRCHCYRSLQS